MTQHKTTKYVAFFVILRVTQYNDTIILSGVILSVIMLGIGFFIVTLNVAMLGVAFLLLC